MHVKDKLKLFPLNELELFKVACETLLYNYENKIKSDECVFCKVNMKIDLDDHYEIIEKAVNYSCFCPHELFHDEACHIMAEKFTTKKSCNQLRNHINKDWNEKRIKDLNYYIKTINEVIKEKNDLKN